MGHGVRPDKQPPPPHEQLVKYLSDSVCHFQRAIQLDGEPGQFHLGFAYVLERGSVFADQIDAFPGQADLQLPEKERAAIQEHIALLGSESESSIKSASDWLRKRIEKAGPLLFERRNDKDKRVRDGIAPLLRRAWRVRAMEEYYIAYEKSIKDAFGQYAIIFFDMRELVGYEAGKEFLNLAWAEGDSDPEQRKRIEKVTTDVKALETKPPGSAITPIIFSITGDGALADLLAPGRIARLISMGTDGPRTGRGSARTRPYLCGTRRGRGGSRRGVSCLAR
jgi:hypothetical protein